MNTNVKVSLIISTYNRPDALEAVLCSVLGQSVMPDEVIIADDGSTIKTKEIVEQYRSKFSVSIQHCWQPDEGFRLSAIRNKAIALAKSEYIISIDGDIILHKFFIEDHKAHAREGFFIQGSRVLVNKGFILNQTTAVYFFTSGIRNRINTLRNSFLSSLFFITLKHRYKCIKGCNMAFWKSDLMHVNGYNEDFVGWGSEDKELAARLYNSGILGKRLKFSAIAYHLHHNSNIDQELLDKNNKLLQFTIAEKLLVCQNGIDRYL
jgi:glycosyltransferase involved in cell wall biosynthesis